MANQVNIIRQSPFISADSTLCQIVPSGNYTTGGDPVNLTPSTWKDPNGQGIIGPTYNPMIPPTITVTDAGGYYPGLVRGNSLSTWALIWYAPGGAQLAAGAYPAAITNAFVMMRVLHNA